MVRFDWATDFPPLVRQLIESHLQRYCVLVPPWCEYIFIQYVAVCDGNFDTIAQTETSPEYRRSRLTIFGKFLDQSPEFIERAIIHELLHIVNETQRKCMRDLAVFKTEGDVPVVEYMREQIRIANEAQTSDLENIVWKLTHATPV